MILGIACSSDSSASKSSENGGGEDDGGKDDSEALRECSGRLGVLGEGDLRRFVIRLPEAGVGEDYSIYQSRLFSSIQSN
jgi:hypothetical protein